MECAVLILLIFVGCERPKSDMGQQTKVKTYAGSSRFADGAGARVPVFGTVANDEAFVGDGPLAMPFPIDRALVEHGQEQFDIYCTACHGRLGNGEGMIVQRGLTRPPSFHVRRLLNAPDSHFFEVAGNGYGAMLGYSDRIDAADRWAIVAYIRTLQAAGTHEVGPTQAALIAQGDRPEPIGGGP